MSGEHLVVLLEGRPIAVVERLRTGSLRLRFDDEYRSDADATPLSVSMSSSDSVHGDVRLTPWLWGLLPDNGDVLAKWGRDFGVSVGSPYPLLGTQVGRDCPGAVQFCPPEEVDDLLDQPGAFVPLGESAVATRLRNLRADSTTWLGPGNTGQFSLGGAQAKMALRLDGGQWGVPSGSLPTTHILKPAIAGFADQHVNEHLCLSAARAFGLPAAVTRIEQFEDETALVVTRFDRTEVDGRPVRVHQEDICQALSVLPAFKYQSEGGPGVDSIAELIRRSVPGPIGETDVWRFADALAFNWLIAGTDAHAKNYSLLLSGPQVRLAPLYDISSYLPYDESKGHKIKLAMKLGGEYRLDRIDRRSVWERVASDLRLDPDRLLERVVALAERTSGVFAGAAENDGLRQLGSDLPDRLIDLVDARARRCVAALS